MSFFKGLEKTAIIGPALDLNGLGIPSLVGYQLGKAHGRAEGSKEKNPPSRAGKLLKGALIPGYIGYRYGKGAGHEAAKKGEKKK